MSGMANFFSSKFKVNKREKDDVKSSVSLLLLYPISNGTQLDLGQLDFAPLLHCFAR